MEAQRPAWRPGWGLPGKGDARSGSAAPHRPGRVPNCKARPRGRNGPPRPRGPPIGHLWAGLTEAHCVPFLSFQVTSASLEASTVVQPPAREPESRPGAPAESLPRGPRSAQELGPARCQQSSLDGAGPDLTGTGRCQLFRISGYRGGQTVPPPAGRGPTPVQGQSSTPIAMFWGRPGRRGCQPGFGCFFHTPWGLDQIVVQSEFLFSTLLIPDSRTASVVFISVSHHIR